MAKYYTTVGGDPDRQGELIPVSVLASLRGESKMEFLDNARKLEIFTIRQVMNFPKRYTEYINSDLVRMAKKIYLNAQEANELFPKRKEDADIYERRERTLKDILILCRQLAGQLDIVWELITHSPEQREINLDIWDGFSVLISTEIKCVTGLMASDERNFALLQGKA